VGEKFLSHSIFIGEFMPLDKEKIEEIKEKIFKAKEKQGDSAAFLIAKDLELKNFDEKQLKSLCPFHTEDSGSFVWNSEEYYFKCFGCGRVYGILDHYMHFYNLSYTDATIKLLDENNIKHRFGEHGIRTEKDYKYPIYEFQENKEIVEKYWNGRGVSKKTLDYTDTQEDKNGNTAFHYYNLNDVLCMIKYRPCRKINKGENKNWSQKNADTLPLLFNMNRVDPSKPLLICEGEGDCLAAIESGFTNSVSVPFGSNNFGWIQENWEWLESFEKIIVWSDSDKPGLEMRREVCSRLGIWRTLFVEGPKEFVDDKGSHLVKDINEVLYYFGKQKVLDLINEAQEIPISGVKSLSKIKKFDLKLAQGLFTHLEPIDKVVYKFIYGSVLLLTGKKGAGKSTLLNQCFVCEPLEQGQDVFIYSGELAPGVVRSWIDLSMVGPENITMDGAFVHNVDSGAEKLMEEWYDNRIWIYEDNSNKESDILDKAISVTRKYGVKVWVLDNLMTLDLGASSTDKLDKQKEFIVKLNNLAIMYGVLVVLVAHPRKTMSGVELDTDDVAGANELGNMAQYIVSVKRYSKKEKAGVRDNKGGYKIQPIDYDVEVDIMKNRYTGKIDKAQLNFDYKSYRFWSNKKELNKRYKWFKDSNKPESNYNPKEENYPENMRDDNE
jgi:archaellum biogenesis ATPase FlaH